ERFCVRNSGARTVVEGVGDHGCEYMTGGRVVVLGPTGRNFAAGMSGGIAYIWDRNGDFNLNCNLATVELEKIESAEEEAEVKEMITRHHQFTGSAVAKQALDDWDGFMAKCVRVMPTDFKRVLQQMKDAEVATV
ncbi:MAG: glutamate synthase, partial [Pirellulaceae bacterium]